MRRLSVSPIGFEPMTASLEGRCSIQLSYEPVAITNLSGWSRFERDDLLLSGWSRFERDDLLLSGWQDSNLRPPRPKRGAITGLRYTPNIQKKAERLGLEPRRQLPVDRLAICSITTLAPLLFIYELRKLIFAVANVVYHLKERNYFIYFFVGYSGYSILR